MKQIYQECVDAGKGDCMRATVASIFELDMQCVPNFILFDEWIWYQIYINFIWTMEL